MENTEKEQHPFVIYKRNNIKSDIDYEHKYSEIDRQWNYIVLRQELGVEERVCGFSETKEQADNILNYCAAIWCGDIHFTLD